MSVHAWGTGMRQPLGVHPQLRVAGGQMGLAQESFRHQFSNLCACENDHKNFLEQRSAGPRPRYSDRVFGPGQGLGIGILTDFPLTRILMVSGPASEKYYLGSWRPNSKQRRTLPTRGDLGFPGLCGDRCVCACQRLLPSSSPSPPFIVGFFFFLLVLSDFPSKESTFTTNRFVSPFGPYKLSVTKDVIKKA